MVARGRILMAWVCGVCSRKDADTDSEDKTMGNIVRNEKRNDSIGTVTKLDKNLRKIIDDGDDVVIRKKKRDGKLVYIVYQQILKIKDIIPCEEFES